MVSRHKLGPLHHMCFKLIIVVSLHTLGMHFQHFWRWDGSVPGRLISSTGLFRTCVRMVMLCFNFWRLSWRCHTHYFWSNPFALSRALILAYSRTLLQTVLDAGGCRSRPWIDGPNADLLLENLNLVQRPANSSPALKCTRLCVSYKICNHTILNASNHRHSPSAFSYAYQ